jgi:CRISPR-associated protein Cst1
MFVLPSSAISFALHARAECPDAWNYLVRSAQSLEPAPERVEQKKTKNRAGEEKVRPIQVYGERNYLFEDLFGLPQNAPYFLHRYLLRTPVVLSAKLAKSKEQFDPRVGYSWMKDSKAFSWTLVQLFLSEVMKMEKERIEAIQKMGDRLAAYIKENDSRLFKQLFTARSEYHLRFVLLKAASAASDVLLPYKEYIKVFFVDDEGETMRSDWSLARDLLMVRIIEQLHLSQWLEEHAELVEQTDQELEESASV